LTVAASLLSVFGVLDAGGGAIFDQLDQLFPDAAAGLATYLGQTATESTQALGGIGGLTLLIIGLVLFNAIEETMTRIWRGVHDRSVMMKLLTFYAVISFGPILIALSVIQTARAQIVLADMGLDISFMGRMMPIIYALIAFSLLFKLVPNADVSWRSALVGGLFTAIVFELAKWGFNLYVSQMMLQTYDRVYGAVALIPIGLIWIYISWLVTLVGAELSFSFQHLRSLMDAEGERLDGKERLGGSGAVHPLVALEVLAPVVRAFDAGQGPVDSQKLAVELQMEAQVIDGILARWEAADVLVAVEPEEGPKTYLLRRPVESLSLEKCLDLFWPEAQHEGLRQISDQYRETSRNFFRSRSGQDLIYGHEVAAGEDEAAE
jgi:membrane protein